MDFAQEMLEAVRAASFGLVVTDAKQPDNPIVFTNPAFSVLTGYQEEEILGRNCRFLQGPETDKATVQEIARAIAEKRSSECKLLNYRKDGSKFWNRLVINPVTNASGEIVRFIGIQEDITRSELQTAKQQQLIKDLNDFANVVAHDLRGPLSNIQQFIELYFSHQQEADAEQALRFLKIAQGSAERASNLVKDLLTLALSSRHGLAKEKVDLNQIVSKVQEFLALEIRKQHATFTVEPLPTVIGSKTQYFQVFHNLIENALKYRKPDSPCQVLIRAEEKAWEQCIYVSDNGRGIPAKSAKSVFRSFKRGDNIKGVAGTGIGLAVVKRIMESAGGRVTLVPNTDEGSTFVLTFPVAETATVRNSTAEQAR